MHNLHQVHDHGYIKHRSALQDQFLVHVYVILKHYNGGWLMDSEKNKEEKLLFKRTLEEEVTW